MTHTLPRLRDSADARALLSGAKVLYTDLDGTLLGRGGSLLTDAEGKPDATAATAVAMVNAAGLPVLPVSGRNVKQLRELVRLFGWRDFIAEVGTVRVRDRTEVRYELGDWTPGLVEETDATPYEIIERSGAVAALMEAFPGKVEYHEPYHVDRLVTHALRGELDLAAAQAVLDTFELPLAVVDNGIIRPMRHTLRGVRRVHALHVLPRGVTKVHAIEADLAERGCTGREALYIGDSVTDVDVAPAVALLVLVSNALEQEELVEAARRLDNAVATDGAAGHGWAELARLWIDALGDAGCGLDPNAVRPNA
jgi:hydroxymethylpyrimidine pyrophosphatase-like HAD family hydrolase